MVLEQLILALYNLQHATDQSIVLTTLHIQNTTICRVGRARAVPRLHHWDTRNSQGTAHQQGTDIRSSIRYQTL